MPELRSLFFEHSADRVCAVPATPFRDLVPAYMNSSRVGHPVWQRPERCPAPTRCCHNTTVNHCPMHTTWRKLRPQHALTVGVSRMARDLHVRTCTKVENRTPQGRLHASHVAFYPQSRRAGWPGSPPAKTVPRSRCLRAYPCSPDPRSRDSCHRSVWSLSRSNAASRPGVPRGRPGGFPDE